MRPMAANEPNRERATPRARYRAQLREEVKQQALRQLAQSGPAGISVNAIGKELGLSGPAIYRYFSSRDDLLTELVIDAYTELADTVRAAITATTSRTPRARFEAFARAYRSWALAQPHRYHLLYGSPLPGYDPNVERLADAAQALMDLLIQVLPASSANAKPPQALAAQTAKWMEARGTEADVATALLAVQIWWRVHGFLSLEMAGSYASMGLDSDALFELELGTLAK